MSCRVGITLGDQAGIGPEIVHAALASGRLSGDAHYSIIGAPIDCSLGQPTTRTAQAAFDALEEAARLALDGQLDAVVTAPINKARMYEIGFKFPGQTEFFADRCGTKNFAMLLTGGTLTVALVTVHVPLRDVPGALKTEEIIRVGLLLQDFLRRRGTEKPRIAVAGLNPHAGESGAIGHEEAEIIIPAVQQLQSAILNPPSSIFAGPFSPDTIFHHA